LTIPLVAPGALDAFGSAEPVVAANPLRAEESVLRSTLLPGLLTATAFNVARGQAGVALFELGTVFFAPSGTDVLPDEREHVAVVLAGTMTRRPIEADRTVDGYDATDLLGVIGDALGCEALELAPGGGAGWHPLRSARIMAAAMDIGGVGELAPSVVTSAGLDGVVVALELDLAALTGSPRHLLAFRPPSPFPPSTIDLAFVVDDAVTSGAIAATLRTTSGDLLEDVRAFDEFRSDALGTGHKSVAFALRFRAPDRTLTDTEVGALRQQAIDAVAAAHDATLRA
jgi:phenylalanyl-tRNA synthetase beta chain